jgi:hypothetical protein
VACAPGVVPSQYGPRCASFSTYESSTLWCGPQGGGGGSTCPKGTHYCGPDQGCAKICT